MGGKMDKASRMFDYWEVNPGNQTATLGQFNKTTSGMLISMIIFKWTNFQGQEINSFRITPKAALKIVVPKTTSEIIVLGQVENLSKTLNGLILSDIESLPIEELGRFDEKILLNVWLELRKYIINLNKNNYESLGTNKSTTIDYLNLQAFGIKDYQKILAEVHNAKPLTIRDRIAYARRHGWIESVGHGERTSKMTRIEE
jgi:hypothetical protein